MFIIREIVQIKYKSYLNLIKFQRCSVVKRSGSVMTGYVSLPSSSVTRYLIVWTGQMRINAVSNTTYS